MLVGGIIYMSTATRVEMPGPFKKICYDQYLPGGGFDQVTLNNRTFRLGRNCGFSSGGTDVHVLELASPKPKGKIIRDFDGAATCGGLWFQVHELGDKGYVAKWSFEDGEWKFERSQDTRLEMPSVDSAQTDIQMLTKALELMTFLEGNQISQVEFNNLK